MAAVTPFEELLYALEDAGLWSDTSDDQKRTLIKILSSCEDVTWTAGGAWRADGEDLADGRSRPGWARWHGRYTTVALN